MGTVATKDADRSRRSWAGIEPAEQQAEQRVPPRRLRERTPVAKQRWDALGSPSWVVAIDEPRKRIERDVLRQRHDESEPLRPDRHPSSDAVECDAEQGTVDRVDQQAGSAPASSPGNTFAEQSDIGIVAAKDPLVDGFLRRPNEGCHCSRRSATKWMVTHAEPG